MGFTAHDVRKLRLCAICDGVGHLDRMLSLDAIHGSDTSARGHLYHGECAVRMLRRAEVLSLPLAEKQKLTLADTGLDLMRELVEQVTPNVPWTNPVTPSNPA